MLELGALDGSGFGTATVVFLGFRGLVAAVGVAASEDPVDSVKTGDDESSVLFESSVDSGVS